jgi:DNA-directed RNA polymerase specialized sigma24 family protein
VPTRRRRTFSIIAAIIAGLVFAPVQLRAAPPGPPFHNIRRIVGAESSLRGRLVHQLTEEHFREKPIFTKFGFTRLLEWLDDGVESNGERYLEIRRRLVQYFDRRDRPSADDLADETLNRVARTLEEAGSIATRPPARYCYVVARFVLLEDCRHGRRHVRLDEEAHIDRPHARHVIALDGEAQRLASENRLEFLDRCLQQLRPDQRDLAIEYFRDAGRRRIERRRELAQRLAITMNALGIRACRIRDSIVRCVESCHRRQPQ